jgi:hypothetical protein
MLTAADLKHGIRNGGTTADRKFFAGRARPYLSPSPVCWGFFFLHPLAPA